jgi:hypothetical protein
MTYFYNIIADKELLEFFISKLPLCQESEQFYVCLFARKKYCPEVPWIKSDKSQLKRFTSTNSRLFNKIEQLECKFGAYKLGDMIVPQHSLALYMSPNPRNLWLAMIRSIAHFSKLIECAGRGCNPHQEVLSEIQKCSGKKKFILFDLDSSDEDLVKHCIDIVDGHCIVTKTRGGYHIMVLADKVKQITEKLWYNKLKEKCDVVGDVLTPPWGTYQGGVVVKPYYIGE